MASRSTQVAVIVGLTLLVVGEAVAVVGYKDAQRTIDPDAYRDSMMVFFVGCVVALVGGFVVVSEAVVGPRKVSQPHVYRGMPGDESNDESERPQKGEEV